jgi:predicted ATPase
MSKVDEEILRIEAALAVQEGLRPTLGDAVVDVTVAALRTKLEALQAERQQEAASGTSARGSDALLLEKLRRHIPRELAEKMRVLGHIEGERKRATVLSARLSGFTALGERLSAEELSSLTSDTIHELAEAIYQYEGAIDRFVGDDVTAIFGAPIAHEDDPERALRAALAMRERIEGINRRWSTRIEQPLSLHIGINTGELITGQVGPDLRQDCTFMGDTVSTAVRLREAARSGQIFISGDTWRLTHASFDFAALEPLPPKSRRGEPLPVYELVRARLLPTKTRGLHELAPAFVGREDELSTLLDAVRGLEEGQGSIITLAGEAGIGKSRLLAECQSRLGERVRWLEGRCFAHTSSVSFAPFLDLLRRKAGITGEHSEPNASALLHSVLENVFPGDAEAQAIFTHLLGFRVSRQEEAVLATLPAQSLRQKIFALVERYYFRLAQRRPTVLVIEDVHWADTSSLELLEHLFAVTGRTRLLLICTSRPQLEGPAAKLLAHLTAHHPERHRPRVVGPLSEAHSVRMIEQLLSLPVLPEALRTLISRRAEGNPFFVEELLRSFIERGALVRGEVGWAVTPLLQTLKVPDTLQGVLMARLDRLPVETKWLAQQASVIGRTFSYRVLMHLARRTAGVDADLAHLEREDIIRERTRDPELEFMFKHALTQDMAYQSLLASRRRELHRQVGEALEALYQDRMSELRSVIGAHYLRGGAWEQAVTHLVAAGDASARLYSHAEAREHYTKALEALSHLSDTEEHRRRRVDTTLSLVSVSFVAVPPERNLQRLAEAETLALDLRTPEGGADHARLARVHYWMGRLHVYQGSYDEAMDYFQRVLLECQGTGDEALMAIPSFMMGRVLALRGHFGQAERLLTQAIEPLARTGEWVNWLWTVGFRSFALAAIGQYRAGEVEYERALTRARETKDLTAIAFCQLALGNIAMFARDTPRMLESSRVAIAAAEQSGDRVLTFLGVGQLAWAQSRMGQHAEAAATVARRKSLMASVGEPLLCRDWFAASDAEMAWRTGRLSEALELAHQAIEEARAVKGIFAEALAQRVIAQTLAAQGNWKEAEHHLQTSRQLFEMGELNLEVAHTHVVWAELLIERGDIPAARAHLEQAIATYERSGIEEELTRARRLLGALTDVSSA